MKRHALHTRLRPHRGTRVVAYIHIFAWPTDLHPGGAAQPCRCVSSFCVRVCAFLAQWPGGCVREPFPGALDLNLCSIAALLSGPRMRSDYACGNGSELAPRANTCPRLHEQQSRALRDAGCGVGQHALADAVVTIGGPTRSLRQQAAAAGCRAHSRGPRQATRSRVWEAACCAARAALSCLLAPVPSYPHAIIRHTRTGRPSHATQHTPAHTDTPRRREQQRQHLWRALCSL